MAIREVADSLAGILSKYQVHSPGELTAYSKWWAEIVVLLKDEPRPAGLTATESAIRFIDDNCVNLTAGHLTLDPVWIPRWMTRLCRMGMIATVEIQPMTQDERHAFVVGFVMAGGANVEEFKGLYHLASTIADYVVYGSVQ